MAENANSGAGLPPGDPQLIALIVEHLKNRGLFDEFRRDCLADVDTKRTTSEIVCECLQTFMENSRQTGKFFLSCTCGLDSDALFKMENAVWSSEQPAYQNLRQKVDNFVASHLSTQEWSPSINKNQVRNGLRHSVVQSGMLESGVDRIITQVVDPKLNHIFRPHIEKAIHEFLTSENKEEGVSNTETEQLDATSSSTPKAQ